MRKLVLVVLSLSVILTAVACGTGSDAPNLAKLKETGYLSLANGAQLAISENPNAQDPTVSLVLALKAGTSAELAGQEGFAQLLGRYLVADSDSQFVTFASTPTMQITDDAISMAITVIKEDSHKAAETMFALLARDLDEAGFKTVREPLLGLYRDASEASVKRVTDIVNSEMFAGLPQGADSAAIATSLEKATFADFQKFYQRVMRPENVAFAAVGQVADNTLQMVNSILNEWPVTPLEEVQLPTAPQRAAILPIKLHPQAGRATSINMIWHFGEVSAPEYYPVNALSFILKGESVPARLTAMQVALINDAARRGEEQAQMVQTEIRSNLSVSRHHSGHWLSISSPLSKVSDLYLAVERELQILATGSIYDARILEQEVADSINYLKGNVLQATQNSKQTAMFMSWSMIYGFAAHTPADHLKAIEGLDKDQLLAAVAKFYRPRPDSMIVFGDQRQVEAQFSGLGDLTVVEQ